MISCPYTVLACLTTFLRVVLIWYATPLVKSLSPKAAHSSLLLLLVTQEFTPMDLIYLPLTWPLTRPLPLLLPLIVV